MTNLPQMASCAEQLAIGSPSMVSSWQWACQLASDHMTIADAIYISYSLLIFTTHYHNATNPLPIIRKSVIRAIPWLMEDPWGRALTSGPQTAWTQSWTSTGP